MNTDEQLLLQKKVKDLYHHESKMTETEGSIFFTIQHWRGDYSMGLARSIRRMWNKYCAGRS